MDLFLLLFVALAPAIFLFIYIRKKDEKRPEPIGQLLKAFGAGVLSVVLGITLSLILRAFGLYSDSYDSVMGAMQLSLFGAALPEEVAKFFMFWLVVRKNRFFDERMDGIVYASCVALGFAALENIMYLINYYDTWVQVGFNRAILSVPGHFFYGILMGYYYSLVKYKNPSLFNISMVLVAPILAHTLYDFLLMTIKLSSAYALFVFVVFFIFFIFMRKRALSKIDEHLEEDEKDFQLLASYEGCSSEVNDAGTAVSEDNTVSELSSAEQYSSNVEKEDDEHSSDDYIVDKYFGGRGNS